MISVSAEDLQLISCQNSVKARRTELPWERGAQPPH
jgi:hypothetical protein